MLVFGTSKCKDFMLDASHWLADGAFRVCPKIFKQQYTVHASDRGHHIPCLFGFLPGKTENIYDEFWNFVFEFVGHRHVPPTILLDFERAAFNAVCKQVGNEGVAGCWFHFRQAVHRNLQILGFTTKYAEDGGFRLRVHKLAGLAFLPELDVPLASDVLCGEFMPDEQPLVAYFQATWVGVKHRRGAGRKAPKFPVQLWNVHGRVMEDQMLTTNAAETWHRH